MKTVFNIPTRVRYLKNEDNEWRLRVAGSPMECPFDGADFKERYKSAPNMVWLTYEDLQRFLA